MRRAIVLAAVLTLSLGVGIPRSFAAEQSDVEKPDAERIMGTWVLESSDRKNPLFDGDGQTVQLKYEATAFEFSVLKDGGKILNIGGSYFVDDKQTPKLLDITLTGDGGSNPVYAIYEFKKDRLHIRIRDNNGPRPADFETPAADCQTLVFKREDAK